MYEDKSAQMEAGRLNEGGGEAASEVGATSEAGAAFGYNALWIKVYFENVWSCVAGRYI